MRTTRWTTILQNQVVAMVLIMLFVVPVLFAAPQARRADQMVVLGFLGLLMMVGWALRAQGAITLGKVRAFLTNGPNLAIVLYAIWNGISAARSTEPDYSRWSLIQLAFGLVLYAVVVYQFRQKEQMRALLTSVLAVAIITVLASLAMQRQQLQEFTGTFKDRQLFGAFLMMLLPVTLGVAAGTRNRVWRMVAQLAVVLVLGALVMSKVRSSWLGSIVSVSTFTLLSLVFVWKMKQMQQRKHEAILAPVLAIVAVAIFVTFSGKAGEIGARLATISSVSSISQDDSFKDRSQTLWAVGQKVVKNAPVTGFGPGTYALAQAKFNPQSRPESLIRAWGPNLFDNPHNLYLQIGGELGWVGLALYLSVIAGFFMTGIRALFRMDAGLRKYTLIGCLAAIAGQSVDAIANPGYGFAEVSTFFWVVLAIGMCAAGIGHRLPETSPAEEPAARPVLPSFLARGFRTAAIGCAAVWGGALLWSLHTATAAAAGAPPIPPSGNPQGGVTPTYSGILNKIDADVLEDVVGPPQAFGLNDFEVYCNRALEFHVFAIADPDLNDNKPDDQFADVTFEKRAFKFKLVGLKGKIFWTNAFNNPRFYFKPARGGCGRSGYIRVFYVTKNPKEVFETRIYVTVLDAAPST